jgi:thioredoxin reductase (NADPH)
VLVIETSAPGGQAGSSSKIENYLGFPTGISGQALAGRALVQAQKFGADVTVASSAVRLRCEQRPYEIDLSNKHVVRARAIIVATGAQYRQLALDNLERLLGVGVYYAATPVESRLCKDEEVIVVGGGNSAGQAAVFLAGGCRHVHVLVRSSGLSDSMSRYLIRRIEQSANITLHVRTQISVLEGGSRLERVTWRSDEGSETREIRRRAQHALAAGMHRPGRQGLRANGIGPACGGLGARAVASRKGAPSLRDELARDLRRGRRALRQHQARRSCGGGGIGVRPTGSSRLTRVS